MKVIFASGIAGCDKKGYLAEFQKLCAKNGKKCKIISIGDLIFEIANEIGLEVKEERILNLPRSTLRTLISLAFERAIKKYDEDVVVFSSHASYWWKTGPQLALDISYLDKINPDMYITIIENTLKIKDTIYSDPKWGKGAISLEEIFIWQELEVYTTEIMSSMKKKDFYQIHRSHPAETLYKLVFEPKMTKIYTAYPILNIGKDHKETTKEVLEIRKFIDGLRKHCIVFDPILKEDVARFKDKKIDELANNATVKRDYRFIDQCDKIIIYFPKMVHSAGVEKEMAYAHQSNKKVWLIYPFQRKSPFTIYYTDRIFKTVNQVLKAVKETDSIR